MSVVGWERTEIYTEIEPENVRRRDQLGNRTVDNTVMFKMLIKETGYTYCSLNVSG
jgi:hypothetical protein